MGGPPKIVKKHFLLKTNGHKIVKFGLLVSLTNLSATAK